MIKFQPGDLCVGTTHTPICKIIRDIERAEFHTPGDYCHAYFITRNDGTILEAEEYYGYANISKYIGCNILIIRWNRMIPELYARGFEAIKNDIGNFYPVWRFLLFITNTDKYADFGEGTCGEELAKFMKGCGICDCVYGITPDRLGKMFWDFIYKDEATLIHEGTLTKEDLG